ncbi:unnamed protein product [Orchesella dallaii]|uniref:VWFA domain-containing protein n=1 Tax=Orchesella dallaii TaxID=48710 RepID=A0ABP1PNQ5_9HEXA
MVFLTDGASENPSATTSAAQTAQSTGVRLFSIGIGSDINQAELLAIAEANENEAQLDRLIYIGSTKNRPLTQAGQKHGIASASVITRESHYFKSQIAAAYEKARDDCKYQLGDDGSLLSIETQGEFANVTEFILSSGDSGSVYWTSGKYNVQNRAFEWENGVRLNPSGPWDVREPKTQTLRTRVALRIRDVPKYATYFNTVSQRYICELVQGGEGEMAEPCYNDNDLIIVVDSSGSISHHKYITFWISLLTWLPPGLTILAMDFPSSFIPVVSVPKNMGFLTDGASENPSATTSAAQTAQSTGVRLFSIGIGSDINQAELLAIAGNNANHIFNTVGFEDLLKLLQPVSRRVCP